MVTSQVAGIRNVAIVGHGAVGKTTLADNLLFRSGVGTRPGSVDDGTSLLDFDEEERERKFSISSSLVHFNHAGLWFNLIDTPGYPDFIGQAIGALHGVETAVIVIAADAGIAVNTRRVFAEAGEAHVGRMILLNKCDHENIDFPSLLEQIQASFGKQCLPLNLPIGLGTEFDEVVCTLPPVSGKHAVLDVAAISQQVMDAIVEADEALMERYLEGEEFSPEEIRSGVTHAIAEGTLIPIFCASASTGVGLPELMDALAEYALPPDAIEREAADPNGNRVCLHSDPDGPLVAQVFKTRIDPFVSKLNYLRIFSGRLAKDASVQCPTTGKVIKLHQLFHVQGGQQEPIDHADAGDIIAVAKVEDLHVGDTICNGRGDLTLPSLHFPSPMIGLAVEPKSRGDQQKISGALHKIEEEDQTFHIMREAQTHEMVMQGMSELHLQIVQHRLHQRDKVDVITHVPRIPYRETISGVAEGFYRHKKQSGGSGQFAEVHLKLQPLPRDVNLDEWFTKDRFPSLREYHYDPDLNFAFVDRVSGGTVPNQFIPAVEKGVRERMEKGVLAGNQVQDLSVELFFGKDHPVDSNETAFRMAASLAFRDLFRQARPTLLEPIMHVEITVPGEKLGDISSELNSRRGRVEGMDGAAGGFQVIIARVPAAEMTTYARSLSSMTGGQGSFTMEFSHYEAMPPNEQAKVIDAFTHHDDEE